MRKPKIDAEKPKGKMILAQQGPVFNDYNKERIYKELRRGLHFKHAATIAGVSERTATGWHQQGKTDQVDFEDGFLDHQTERAVFYIKCEQAKSEFIAKGIDKIRDSEDWRATQFLIQAADREGYQPSQKIDMNKNVNQKIVMEVVGGDIWKKDVIEETMVPLLKDADTYEGEYVEDPNDGNVMRRDGKSMNESLTEEAISRYGKPEETE